METIEQDQPEVWKQDLIEYLETGQKAKFSPDDRKGVTSGASILRDETYNDLQPLLKAVPNGERKYLEELAKQANGILTSSLKTDEFSFDDEVRKRSDSVRAHIIGMYENSLHNLEFGLSSSNPLESRWDLVNVADNTIGPALNAFQTFTQSLLLNGAETKKWFINLEKIKQKIFSRMDTLNQRTKTSKESVDLNESINSSFMDSIDELFLALDFIPEKYAKDKTLSLIDGLDRYLSTRGLERKRPNIGDAVDFTYQEAIYDNDHEDGNRIIKVTTNAFFDKKTGQNIRPAKVIIS